MTREGNFSPMFTLIDGFEPDNAREITKDEAFSLVKANKMVRRKVMGKREGADVVLGYVWDKVRGSFRAKFSPNERKRYSRMDKEAYSEYREGLYASIDAMFPEDITF